MKTQYRANWAGRFEIEQRQWELSIFLAKVSPLHKLHSKSNSFFDFIGENPDGTKYQTAYRCEGQTLEITCESRDSVIEVVRANYGRFSIAICNRNGFTDWSVNCMAPKTKRVLKEK